MITGTPKPLEQILEMVEPYKRIVVAGCFGCVTVCRVGGEKEVQILSSSLRLAREASGNPVEIKEVCLERQCDPEYLEQLRPYVSDYDAVLSIACGAGIQFVAEKYHKTPVLPGINTGFLGVTERQGEWSERCQGCGDCVLHLTGGICPVSRCAKQLFHGPCGGSSKGICEVSPDVACGWQLIVDRLKALNQLHNYGKIIPYKGWSTSRDGGPRRIIREDMTQ
ncbi:methylenetetrahydrofolate reductase C-terminal domain-containing protein [Desulfosediminicola flagellatus]|uniref:methylenetetrahydrofolate reductase C-terminal domain-containing protein n=1 Tax=Desulfosediminicola flagellatus TaxID=2569541 RepID=UPI0010ACC6F0|nr:methylenetetrahydrofolate reductase C-terminal domain-containing protein [Desulfosediminicola flagellatus]